MGEQRVKIYQLADVVMKGLQEYAELATDEMKSAVKKSSSTVKKEISANAPKRKGTYAASWRTKTTKEDSHTLEITVYSPKRYMLAHLLEKGHAKRGGGRVRAIPHIAPAEEAGIKELEERIERALS